MIATLRQTARAGALGLAVVLSSASGLASEPCGITPESARASTEDSRAVTLSVAVTDKGGQSVSGLRKEDFRVSENGVEQAVTSFSTEPGPVSWGIVFDRSSKVRSWMAKDFSDAALHMVAMGTPEDEMFVMAFADDVQTILDFTTDRDALASAVPTAPLGGGAALYDAVAAALDRVKTGKHAKKVLVVVASGEDTASRINFSELASRAEGSGVIIYSAGIFAPLTAKEQVARGGYPEGELKRLADLTGGSAHFPFSMKACAREMHKIGVEVSRLYTLGYTSTNAKADGKWRKVRVAVERVGAPGKYTVRTRTGYHAPSETASR
jgi:Ca-activated chloride channel homolog